ncbi:DnaJ family molecular chaperone [Brevundimonas sp. 2R-24]|uniref:DnaJ family molecular chaperone n=1 Tax=Peiella sedimenti TaxID=3061083 RepID=A0ABT8SME7_9CAUL|nr:DnaJ family molecular chaperone [Caulobacteraceae bacterium XZ-24]
MGLLSRIVGSKGGQPRKDGRTPGCAERDGDFTASVTALGAKLAGADGEAGAAEFAAFTEAFQPSAANLKDVRRLYDLARRTTAGYESYARRLYKRYGGCPRMLEGVLEGLFHVAAADGAATASELDYLKRVGELFGLEPLVFRRLKAVYFGLDADDPYVIMGVGPEVSDAELAQARRRLLADTHPDRLKARGLPPSFEGVFAAKAAAVNAAFDEIMRERRLETV